MKRKNIGILGATVLILCSSAAWPKAKSTNTTDLYDKFEYTRSEYKYFTDKEFEILKKWSEKESKKRNPQSVTSDLKSIGVIFSADYLNLQSKLIGGFNYSTDENGNTKAGDAVEGVKTVAELEVLVNNANNPDIYNKLKPDAKFIAAALGSTAPTRGLAYRARPLFDRSNLVHAVAITALRGVNTGINVFAPTNQWKVGFNYFTYPVGRTYSNLTERQLVMKPQDPSLRLNTFIETEEETWAYINYEVLPALDTYASRIRSLIDEVGDKPIFVDARLAKSTGSGFTEAQDQFYRIGKPELYLILSNLLYNRSSLKSALAYRWTGLFDVIERMAKVYGFNAMFNPAYATAQKRNEAITKGNGQFLTLRDKSNGKELMEDSYKDLKESVKLGFLAWTSTMKSAESFSPATINPILDPRVVQPYQRAINRSFYNLYSATGLLDGSDRTEKIVSAVNESGVVNFKLYDFYHGDTIPKNLKDFFPTNYQGGEDEFSASNTSDPELNGLIKNAQKNAVKKFNVRNYLKGSPSEWNIGFYKNYFPDVNDNQGVINAAQVLSEAWGGWIIGLPLNAVVL
jgi:hypothetical protein